MSSLQLSTAASTVTGVYGGDLPTHQHSGLQSDDGDGGDGEEEEEGDDSDDSDVAHMVMVMMRVMMEKMVLVITIKSRW